MKKVLIANRGEIAVRIIRTLKEMNIASVAVYSSGDKDSLHVALADEAYCIGGPKSSDSYLNIDNILQAALMSKADAVHPGYGFLSETPEFAERTEALGLIFIGPSAETMAKMGNKSMARQTMEKAGVPVIPGSDGIVESKDEVKKLAAEISYPIVIKAVSGGGGKGMRFAHSDEDVNKLYDEAKKEAKTSFNDDRLYIEKYIPKARHIEIQVIGDGKGGAVHLFERDCTIQRNNQKLLEEAPAVILSDKERSDITETTRQAVAKLNYRGAGTIEYLYVSAEKRFYFIEMNTRVQVEHTVSEEVTGMDIIKAQINVAFNSEIGFTQNEVKLTGHAIEARLNAEDPENRFMPSPGKIEKLHFGQGRNVRIDTHIYNGYSIPPYYDSMIAKVIVKAENREDALYKLKLVLGETVIEPIKTNLDFQYYLLGHPKVSENDYDIKFIHTENIIE
ncbi:Biotin carboxylase [Jeotgalicoccus saudimassiliensis]|uniref:biotin carboxylase n=1 Tax=Jeotgalicoccus saudimassiliensis TaxID=1461582 RepID=A0A078MGB3_9STAP|nr:acetyl-CoA carboxylase biotin carboxylase subunit [Jeotgalicoccus saudimassiliensis]CEA03691.1 Biotin carboxylase [Jeotgalicoccus saudimassiliensis]